MFKEKLTKQLFSALQEIGITEPTELQANCFSKINAGQDIIATSIESVGKSTLAIITALHKLKYAFEDAPRALIIVPDKEKAAAMRDKFKALSYDTDLRIHEAHEGIKFEKLGEDIYLGSDIVIGTPLRVFDLYLKHHLNLNKIKLFILDDADLIVKNAYQGQIDRLTESLPKCQHLIFTKTYTDRVEKLIAKFMVAPVLIEA